MDKRVPVTTAEPGEAAPGPEELLRRVAGGDEAAFEALYDVIAGPVMGVVVRVLRDRAQAEEVTQEVLLEVWRQAARYEEDRAAALSWVLMIAHRRAVDRVRSHQAALDRDDRAGRMDVRRPFDQVSEATFANVDQRRVRRCLGALTDLQRESIVLAYYNGYTYREVGVVLKTPPGTVKTRIRDGLIRLRDCLGVTS
ncbi:ECF RNA polymerase sigma factor SigK [Amycolatopsis sp. 195334CR]|uniref:ECF RNA polymerase sigma factor SigK n=1 Tax=Amycolatopsis sp. 195334CR TaxID=2814588 RepID=UPI0035AB941B